MRTHPHSHAPPWFLPPMCSNSIAARSPETRQMFMFGGRTRDVCRRPPAILEYTAAHADRHVYKSTGGVPSGPLGATPPGGGPAKCRPTNCIYDFAQPRPPRPDRQLRRAFVRGRPVYFSRRRYALQVSRSIGDGPGEAEHRRRRRARDARLDEQARRSRSCV